MLKTPPNKAGQLFQRFLWRALSFLDDKQYIALYYYLLRGRRIVHMQKPEMLCDKINWLKINYRDPLLHTIVDKYAVRDYVAGKIGEKYLNELYFISDNLDRSFFENLPRQFVLKGTHGSDMNFICYNKELYAYNGIKKAAVRWLYTDYYSTRREWAYKNLQKRVMCEKLLLNSNGKIPEDIKIICFKGKPELIQVDFDRFESHTRDLYTTEWEKVPFTFRCDKLFPNNHVPMAKPDNLEELLGVAETLSGDFPFARIDLYNIDQQRIVFGEITIYPGSGSGMLYPEEYDYQYGKMLETDMIAPA